MSDFAIGKRVKVDGLNSMPHYNGTYATIQAWSEKNERWKILMDYDSTLKELKNKNMTVVDEAE